MQIENNAIVVRTRSLPKRTQEIAPQPEPVQIVWEFWRMNQLRSFHGPPAVLDLGDISDTKENHKGDA